MLKVSFEIKESFSLAQVHTNYYNYQMPSIDLELGSHLRSTFNNLLITIILFVSYLAVYLRQRLW